MSVGHWLVVMLVIAIVFGPKRLGSLGRGIGDGIRSLKDGLAGRGEDESVGAAKTGRVAERQTDRS